MGKDATKETVKASWKVQPVCNFHMVCWHNETKYKTITETKDGKTVTRTET